MRYLIGSRAQTFERLTALVVPASDRGVGLGGPTLVLPRMELAALKQSAVADLWPDGARLGGWGGSLPAGGRGVGP